MNAFQKRNFELPVDLIEQVSCLNKAEADKRISATKSLLLESRVILQSSDGIFQSMFQDQLKVTLSFKA